MRITYDRQVDAASVFLREIEPAGARTLTVSAAPTMLNLDFDATGRLVGIDAIPASALLPAVLLAAADARGK